MVLCGNDNFDAPKMTFTFVHEKKMLSSHGLWLWLCGSVYTEPWNALRIWQKIDYDRKFFLLIPKQDKQ